MLATKQTARKSTGGRVGHYTLAGDQFEDEDEELGDTGDDEEYADEAEDASMAIETERVQDLRQQLDPAREKIDAELNKGAARDKELVAAYELRVEDFRKELETLTHARAERDGHLQSQTAITSAGQGLEQAIRDHGETVVDAINEGDWRARD